MRKFLTGGMFLFVLANYLPTLFAAEAEFAIEPIPTWTSSIEIDTNTNPLEETSSIGVFYLLTDIEVNGATKERYLHFAKKFLSSKGVEANSQLSFNFDPAYEKLILHKIVIHRGSEVFDELDGAKIRVIQQERDLDRLLYNGSRTAFVFLEDVRVGDWVEYAFTIRGRNPLEGKHFYDAMQLRWPFPVQSEHYRLLWPRSFQPLWVQLVKEPSHNRNVTDQFYEYAWNWENRPGQEFEEFVPSSVFIYPTVHFSDFESWEDVAIWAGETFHAQPPSKELQEKVLTFESEGATAEQRVIKALEFVQDNIRYLGVENGINGRKPTDPSVVLARGYGDCKDKALLFCTILHSMGVDASPVLVSTGFKGYVKNLHPTPWLFNHVIVQVILSGNTNYVDVTRTLQRGALNKRYIDDFGAGVLLSETSTGLISIPHTQAGLPATTVEEFFNIPTNGPTRLTIVRTYDGADADTVRGQLSAEGSATINKNDLVYYRKYYPDVVTASPMETMDNQTNNRIRTTEHYVIPAIWKRGQLTNYLVCSFYTDGLTERLLMPSKKERKLALTVPFPESYTHRIQIDTPEVWRIDSEDKKIETKGFLFHHNVTKTNGHTFFASQLVTIRPGIDAVDVPNYVDGLEQVSQLMVLTISKPLHPPLVAGGAIDGIIGIAVIFYLMVLAMFAVLIYRFKFKTPPAIVLVDPSLIGLGGWLILRGFGILLAIVISVGKLAPMLAIFSSARWRTITDTASPTYNAMLPSVLLFELFANLTMFVVLILLAVLFFQKRRMFPNLFITYMVLQCVIVALDATLMYFLHQNSASSLADSRAATLIVPTIISSALWCGYMLRSRRVKATFVN